MRTSHHRFNCRAREIEPREQLTEPEAVSNRCPLRRRLTVASSSGSQGGRGGVGAATADPSRRVCVMAHHPQGYLYQPSSASLALYSCPAYGAPTLLGGARSEELGRSGAGSAFSPYPASAAFATAAAAAATPHAYSPLQYTAEHAAFPGYVASPYDPTGPGLAGGVAAYHPYGTPLGPYPYSDAAYRKNATRDATATLKAWLNEHRKNPYPTKGEKIMLAIITKMTLTQVSTWFANARRRLKKENKVTWAPRAKSEDEEEEEDATIDLEKTDDDAESPEKGLSAAAHDGEGERRVVVVEDDGGGGWRMVVVEEEEDSGVDSSPASHALQGVVIVGGGGGGGVGGGVVMGGGGGVSGGGGGGGGGDASVLISQSSGPPKPKLWSLAEIACATDAKQNQLPTQQQQQQHHQHHHHHHHPHQQQHHHQQQQHQHLCALANGVVGGTGSGTACVYPNSAGLARPVYYSSPFYSAYTGYAHFAAHHGLGGLAATDVQSGAPSVAAVPVRHHDVDSARGLQLSVRLPGGGRRLLRGLAEGAPPMGAVPTRYK
ncbi:unnamed protein product, partial [Lampetra fluviatilis]